jgi:hypothetical protein
LWKEFAAKTQKAFSRFEKRACCLRTCIQLRKWRICAEIFSQIKEKTRCLAGVRQEFLTQRYGKISAKMLLSRLHTGSKTLYAQAQGSPLRQMLRHASSKILALRAQGGAFFLDLQKNLANPTMSR